MKWEELPLADRAQLMAAAVRNGYTDIRSIKAAYANFQNQRQQTGNMYDEGGEFEVVNPLDDVPVDDQEERYQYFRSTLPENLQNDTVYRLRRAWELNGEPKAFSDAIVGDNPMFNYNIDDSLYHGNSVAYNPDTDEYEFLKPVDHDTVDLELMQYFNNPELEQIRQNYQMDWDEDGSRGYYKYVPRTDDNALGYGGNLFKTGGNKQSKKDYYRQQLIIRGLRGAQLEAVLANIEVESGFNPKAYNKSSGAQGLMQWLGSRKPKSWSEKDQLDYIAATYNKFGGNEWLDKKAWKRFNETTDPAEAARLFRRYWERPERSSWNATDALFKGSKSSYLPKEVNDLVAQVSNLQYDEPKAPIFTEEDQRLLDTPALAFYNPEYEDPQAPDYKPSALQESIKLDESLWRNPANMYNQFANMQQGSSQDDPLGWMTMMASLSPKTTPQQKEAASTMYQLFAPQDGDYSYHGLNFAAYGGKVNRFDDGGRTITIGELPEAYVRAHGNMPVVTPTGNRTTLSDAYKNYNQTPVNTDDVPGLTDYLVTQEQPDIADAREIELAQQHRANERFNKSVDAAAIGLMSIPGLVPAAGTVLPLLAPGTVGGTLLGEAAGGMAMGDLLNESSRALTGRDWGENLRYGIEDTADMIGLGYDPESWSPFAQGMYNFATDMTNPGYFRADLIKSGIGAVESGISAIEENTLPVLRNMYTTYNLSSAPRASANYRIFPNKYHQSVYSPQNVIQTRWYAEDMAAPESSDIAKSAAQKIAGNENATFGIRRDYDLMYRPNEYNAAIYEGRYPFEDGTIPEAYKQVVQSEANDAIQRMANMGIMEHGVLSDDVVSNILNNAGKTKINLVDRKNSNLVFNNPETLASTTMNSQNFSPGWIVGFDDAYPATMNIPLFNTQKRYSNILEPVREIRIPFNMELSNRGVVGPDNKWRLNDPYFGKQLWEFDLGRLPSEFWNTLQHEAQHAVGQQMIDLSATHQPKYHGLFDTEGNLLYRVENPKYPMGLIERNADMGTKNWGKDIGGKADEIDAELHTYIAQEQFLHPEQNISNWNSLFNQQREDIVKNLSGRFGLPTDVTKNIIENIMKMRKIQGYR